jgi:hypothetical protein
LNYIALALFGLGVADLVRWSPGQVSGPRAAIAAGAGTVAVAVVAALSGIDGSGVALAAFVAFVVLSLWSAYDLIQSRHAKGQYPIVLVVGAIIALLAVSGSAEPVGGQARHLVHQP